MPEKDKLLKAIENMKKQLAAVKKAAEEIEREREIQEKEKGK